MLSEAPLATLPEPWSGPAMDRTRRTGQRCLVAGAVLLLLALLLAVAGPAADALGPGTPLVGALLGGCLGLAGVVPMVRTARVQGAHCQTLLDLCEELPAVAAYCQRVRDLGRTFCNIDLHLVQRYRDGSTHRAYHAACRRLHGLDPLDPSDGTDRTAPTVQRPAEP